MVKNIQFVEIPLAQINTKYIEENEVILKFQKHPDFLMEAMVAAIDGGYQFLEPICFHINSDEDYYLVDGWDVYQAYQEANKKTITVELRQDNLDYHLSLITAQKKPLRHICPSLKIKNWDVSAPIMS
ncbi:MAG: hypothetical protein SAJ12_07215 [Jaaginema sp. PMC 1079.18]|nr:hypothetical protein [Jaaginema sp. PMC 1080.18]MEC4850786.1 hypothetical protein [Jaaginema sp. PMC 1079.18]MEC4865944.1 hypothetical protein [Jaaginema sp. PMC 1078.18]